VRKGETEKRVESLPKTIEEACAIAMAGVGRDLRLDIRVDTDAAAAVIDKIQIQQVLLNLIRNAVEAMEGWKHRALAISTRRAGGMVEIRIADTGPGLPDKVRARLFQPFVTTKENGMGVGLSSVAPSSRPTAASSAPRTMRAAAPSSASPSPQPRKIEAVSGSC